MEQLKAQFPDDLLVVTRHRPAVRAASFPAAVAAEAAGRRGMFEEYSNRLYDEQLVWRDLTGATLQDKLDEYANDVGLDPAQFAADMADSALTDRVQRDLDAAGELGVTGTPTFFLNGARQPVTPDSAQIQAAIDAANDAQAAADAAKATLLADDHTEGPQAASAVLVEYVDFQCPTCGAAQPFVQQLQTDFPDDLLVVTRHFPRFDNAFPAAVASEAAARQGAFNTMVDKLFEEQSVWGAETDPIALRALFVGYAGDLSLNTTTFENDLDDPSLTERVQRDLDAANALGLTGTPSYFLNGVLRSSTPTNAQIEAAINDEFTLNRFTGDITVRNGAGLDFETNPTFMLEVRSTNGTTETIDVTIDVIDAFNG